MPFILMGAGLVALIIFFSVLFPKEKEDETPVHSQPDASELRLDRIEDRLYEIERLTERSARPDAQNKEVERLTDRLDKLEESLNSRIDDMTKRLEYLQKRTVSGGGTAASRPLKLPETRKPSVTSGVRYHQVRPGQTLYQISHMYGLTVEQLRHLNDLSPGAIIRPGQRLRINP